MSPRPYQDCYNTAIRLLTRRDHSCKELDRKLRQRQFEKDHIQMTLAECRRLNYLDDDKFADIYTGQLQRRGYGPRRIKQMLAAKGVTHELIVKSLRINCSENKELDHCREVLAKKLKTFSQHPSNKIPKERLYRFLSGRGFSPAVIRKIMNEAFS